eukprot:167805_1
MTKFGSMIHLLPQQQLAIWRGELFVANGADIDYYALLTLILRLLIGTDQYEHIYEKTNRILAYYNLQNVMKEIENKIKNNKELLFFITIFQYIRHDINHFNIDMHRILKSIPKRKDLIKENKPIYNKNEMFELINMIDKQTGNNNNENVTQTEWIQEYFMAKLKYICESARQLFRNVTEKWVENKKYKTDFYIIKKQKKVLMDYLTPKYVNPMQISTHYEQIADGIEELIGDCNNINLTLNSNESYGPSRGKGVQCKGHRYKPF